MHRHRYGEALWLQGACFGWWPIAAQLAVRFAGINRFLVCCAGHCRSWHGGQQGLSMQMCMSTSISCRNCACQHAHFTVGMLSLVIIACRYTSVPISHVNMHYHANIEICTQFRQHWEVLGWNCYNWDGDLQASPSSSSRAAAPANSLLRIPRCQYCMSTCICMRTCQYAHF